jgi:penicillin-binding protein 2
LEPGFTVNCRGGASFYGRFFRCHLRGGHGRVDLHKAIAQSCDVFFYTVGNMLGIDKMAEYSTLTGLGRRTGIDLPEERSGVVPSSAWKLRLLRERWYAGETISVSIGQGALTVTPLQMATAIGGLAMGGVWHRPHLVPYDELQEMEPDLRRPTAVRADLNAENVQAIVRGMWAVVNDGGTGGRARLRGYDVCGKTGTAQLASARHVAGSDDPNLRDTAWFVGFAPCEAPEIVVTALFENGEHGHLAGPIVRDVIKAHWDKKERMRWTQRQPIRPRPLPASEQAATARLLRQEQP